MGYLHRYPRDADWKGETEKTSSKVSNETNDRRKDVQPEKRESNRTETPSTPGKSLHAGKDTPGTHHRSGLNNRESLIQLNIKIPPEMSTGDDTGYRADDEKNVGVQTVAKEEEQNWQTGPLPHASQKLQASSVSKVSQPSVPLPSQQEAEQNSDNTEQTEAPDTQSKLQEIFRALRVRNMPIGDAGEPEKPHPSYRKYIDEWPGDVDVIDDESDNEMDDDMDDKADENSLFTIHVSVDKGTNQNLVADKLNKVPHCSNGGMRKLPVPSFTHHVKTYLAYRGLRVKHFKPIFAKHGQHAFLFSALSEDDKDANGLVALEIDVGKPREVRGFVFKALRGMTDKDEGNNDEDEDEGGQATVTKFKLQYTDSDSIWRAIKTDEGKSLSDFDDELDLEPPMRPMSADRMRSSPSRRPLRASHELGIPLQDSDSGFSSTMRTKPDFQISPQRHQQYRNRSPHMDSQPYSSPMLSDTESIVSSPAHLPPSSRLFRSRSMTRLDDSLLSDSISMPNSPGKSPERHRYRNSPDRSYGAYPGMNQSPVPSHRHMKDMLEDSENRRAVLMHKLKEAQITLQAQSERVGLIENAAKDNSGLVEELKCKEKDYRQRISSLTRGQDDTDALRRENLHLREEMQNRISTLDLQLKTLHNQHSVTESENKKRNGLLEQTTMTLTLLEEENAKLQKERDTAQSELYMNRDSIHIMKTKNALLDEENRTLKQDLYRLHEEDNAVQGRLCELSSQVEELRMLSQTLRGENEKLSSAWESSLEEKQKLKKELDSVQEKCSEMKSHLSATVGERDRVLHEKMDIHQSLQQLILDKEHLMKTKLSLEEQMCKQNDDTEEINLVNEQHEMAKRKLEEELQAVKKVGEDLSSELSTVKNAYKRTQEQINLLENGKRLSAEQQRLVEQENRRLETEVTKMKQLVESREDECRKEREQLEESAHRLRDELRSLRMNKTELEDSCHDLEMRLKRTSGDLQDSTSMQHTEIETWRNTCERLTKSVSSKEAELQELSDKCSALDEMVSKLKADSAQYKEQAEGLMYEQQEMDRLKLENNELLKQKEEDEQMIRLLEMQKAVFAKTSENEFGNLQEIEQLSHRLTEMEGENENLRDRIDELQNENDKVLLQQETQNLNDSDLQMSDMVDAPDLSRFVGVKNERERLRQMNAVLMRRVEFLEQERTDSKLRDDTDVASSHSLKQELERLRKENSLLQFERDHLRKQHKVLEEKHHRFIISFGHGREQQPLQQSTESSTELVKMKKQNEVLHKQLNLIKGQLKIYKGGKMRLIQLEGENEPLKEEPLPQQNGVLVNGNPSTHKLTGEVMNLKQELEQSQDKQKEQKELITSLKHELSKHIQEKAVIAKESLVQSLDDVSDELVQVKSELERLMGVIDHKDHEIEELDTQLQESLCDGEEDLTKSPKQDKPWMPGMRVSKSVKNTKQPAYSATPRPIFKSKLQSLLDKYSNTQPSNGLDRQTNGTSYESNHNDTNHGHNISAIDDNKRTELIADQTVCNNQQINSVDYPGDATSQVKYNQDNVECSAEIETAHSHPDSSDSQDDDINAVRLSYMDLVKF